MTSNFPRHFPKKNENVYLHRVLYMNMFNGFIPNKALPSLTFNQRVNE